MTNIDLRPYGFHGANGSIPQVDVNFLDLGISSGKSKDTIKSIVEKVIREMSDKVQEDSLK